jgi:O-antigen/teichoic acid export membrane protein
LKGGRRICSFSANTDQEREAIRAHQRLTPTAMTDHSAATKVLNLGIRATTLACRFLFIFFLAKLLSPSEIGLYGLVTATVAYALYFVGLDFYTFTTRELAGRNRAEWGGLLKSQMALSAALYIIVLPALTGVFFAGLLPWALAPWFFLLIVVEHICQELTRLFIAVSEQLAASFVQFLRQGTWAVVIIGAMFYDEEYRNLEAVFTTWVLACFAAIGFSIWKLRILKLGGWAVPVDRKWIFRGIKIALPFLMATLAVRGVFTVDRYWMEFLVGLEVVGAYVLFFGVSSTLMAFLDAGVFSFAYPSMIRAFKESDPANHKRKMKEMGILALAFCGLFAFLSSTLLPHLLGWLDKVVYLDNYYLYYWLLAAAILNALGMVPHYGVYSQNLDRSIVQSHLGSLPIFIVATALATLWSPILAVAIGVCVSQLFVLIWKSHAYMSQTPPNFLLWARD